MLRAREETGLMGATPHDWKCGKCNRKSDPYRLSADRKIYIARTGKPVPTGRVKHPDAYRPSIEYRCEVCGHVGWSRHPRAVAQARIRGFVPLFASPKT